MSPLLHSAQSPPPSLYQHHCHSQHYRQHPWPDLSIALYWRCAYLGIREFLQDCKPLLIQCTEGSQQLPALEQVGHIWLLGKSLFCLQGGHAGLLNAMPLSGFSAFLKGAENAITAAIAALAAPTTAAASATAGAGLYFAFSDRTQKVRRCSRCQCL